MNGDSNRYKEIKIYLAIIDSHIAKQTRSIPKFV